MEAFDEPFGAPDESGVRTTRVAEERVVVGARLG